MTALLRVRSLDRTRTGGASPAAPPAVPDPTYGAGARPGLDVRVVGRGSGAIAAEIADQLRSRGHRVTDAGAAGRPEVLLVVGAGAPGDLAPLCGTVRAAHPGTALMALGGGGVDECVAALEAGMDDYVAYPCTAAELESRMRAVLRRRARPVERLAMDDLVLEPSTMSAWRANRPLDLTTGEFRVLEALLRNPNRVMDRGELHRATGSVRRFMASRTVDVCIHSLRQKVDRPFGRDSIATVRGVGYRLRVARPGRAE